jgi:hypothetical protein
MQAALRAAGYSLMIMFVSCGVGAQQTDGLPTSNGSAQGIFRLDRPKPEVASGEWKMPPLTPVNSKQ